MGKLGKKKLGILGGSFDPPHVGHLKISLEAKKRFKLNTVIWAVTNKNPFKNKCENSLKERIFLSKKLTLKNKFIKIEYYDKKLRSNRTINLIRFIEKKYHNTQLFFIIGADNLINFHKWYKWKLISQKCKIIVFDRHGYKKKSLNSTTYKRLNRENLKFIEFEKVNISSSQLRKI